MTYASDRAESQTQVILSLKPECHEDKSIFNINLLIKKYINNSKI